jgi:hypothetical protein
MTLDRDEQKIGRLLSILLVVLSGFSGALGL